MLLAGRLTVPDEIRAVLFDLDGVLLDTLSFEEGLVDGILQTRIPDAPPIPREVFRRAFALPIAESWRLMLEAMSLPCSDDVVQRLTTDLASQRANGHPEVLIGAAELLRAAAGHLRIAIVSNNSRSQVRQLLEAAGLLIDGVLIVGTDDGHPSKPAPDMYEAAAHQLGLPPAQCVAVEDSLIGARAARGAGAFVVGVATGPCDFDELATSTDVDVACANLESPAVSFAPGDVTDKRIDTPNEFVSHMVEHIAWRSGCSVSLTWLSDDWRALGREVGAEYARWTDREEPVEVIGLIDDGSARVRIGHAPAHVACVSALAGDLDWFLGLRVEQLPSGHGLVELISGIAEGGGLRIDVEVVSIEDAHHTWEAIFRAIGVCLRDLSSELLSFAANAQVGNLTQERFGVRVLTASARSAAVVRETAESVCRAELVVDDTVLEATIITSESIDMRGLDDLLTVFGRAAGLGGAVEFRATQLSSSHVVAEDIGMTIGEALRALATERMQADGLEGFGFGRMADRLPEVALSWEGRKFLKIVGLGWSERDLKRFRLGTTLTSGLFSEDLDDFLDGFVGGMHASVMIHWPRTHDLDEAWEAVFYGLGASVGKALMTNRSRRGLIAGVKATLA
ncbi:MAG: HAD family hydrolase [Solirubrobacteraceae bacterium]